MKNLATAITKPCLLVDKNRALKNIETMVNKARRSHVRFRPHFKTHQSAQIGEWFREFDVDAITVSSVDMATYFAQWGWKDITIAFPVNILEIKEINDLAGSIKLNLLVEAEETVRFLKANLNYPVNLWIKVDVGYHRTGIPYDDFELFVRLINEIKKANHLHLMGLLTHSGHAYRAKSPDEIKRIYRETVFRMNRVQKQLTAIGLYDMALSIGDTPSCSLVDDFSEVDEIRPGNFIFYDATQLNLGVCRESDIAVAVACPVVAKHRRRKEIIIYGGAVHLSKESLINERGEQVFGYVAKLSENGWEHLEKNSYVSGLSQEHGIVKTDNEFFANIAIGDVVAIVPVHSCLTVNLMGEYRSVRQGEIIKIMGQK